MEQVKKGKVGLALTLSSLTVLIVAVFTSNAFSDGCAVPIGRWNIFFSLVMLMIGIVYILNDFVKVPENIMANLVRGTMIFMIVVFLWGDFFLMLIFVDSPKCLSFMVMIVYLMLMFMGTIFSAIEGFSIIRSVFE